MNEYISYIPGRDGKAHIILPLSMFTVGFSAMIASSRFVNARAILQLLCLCFIVIGVQLTTRYALCFYKYSIIISDSGNASLVITRLQGQHKQTVCVAPASSIAGIFKIGSPEIPGKFRKATSFSFCVNMFPKNTVTVMLDAEKAELSAGFIGGMSKKSPAYIALKLEYDGSFMNALTSIADTDESVNLSESK